MPKTKTPEKQFTDRISGEALNVLRNDTEVVDDHVKLTCGQLERDVYESVNEVLVRIGGKWKGNKKVHEFPYDPTPLLAAVIASGLMPPKNPLAYFPTPQPVVARVLDFAKLDELPYPETARFLEPSSGQGAIARAIVEAGFGKHQIHVCELEDLNASVLEDQGFEIVGRDFLEYQPAKPYHRILMNPPFSVAGDPRAYITHIEHAWQMLAPGGVLVAIAPPFDTATDNRRFEFTQWAARYGSWEEIEKGAFKESGTNIITVVMQIEKPYPHEEVRMREEEHNGYPNYYCYLFWLFADNDRTTHDKKMVLLNSIRDHGFLEDGTFNPALASAVHTFIRETVQQSFKEGMPVGLVQSEYALVAADLIDDCRIAFDIEVPEPKELAHQIEMAL